MVVNWNDSLTILRKLTARRAWNAFKIYGSYYTSKVLGKPIQMGLPLSFSVEPTTACNLGCPECPSGLRSFTRPTGNLKDNTFEKIIDELHRDSMYITFYFQGEPYIHPKFLDHVRYAADRNMYTATSTNAHFLNDENARSTVESGLNRLIISIDGTTQETYSSYRKNGELEKVLEGTKNVIKWKKKLESNTPQVIFQFLVVKPNEHQTQEIEKIGNELGVDAVKFKTAQFYDYKNGHELMPSDEKHSRYRKNDDNTYSLKNKMDNHCWKMWHSCVFTWDGSVVPCCFDKDASHKFGNIQQESFKTIWKNKRYMQFRKSLMQSRKEIDICSNCSEGSEVWQN